MPENDGEVELAADPDLTVNCEKCGSTDIYVLVFSVLLFVGIAPIAYCYKLTPKRYVLCAAHGRRQAIRSCLHTALVGYLGFPGFLAAPYYICKNLWALRRAKIADTPTIILCILNCVILPCALITMLLINLLTRLA